jgi:purine catabolism regulator
MLNEQLHKEGDGGVTVSELTETTALSRATLMAGGDGLGRTVRRVQWMEVLDDFADYLSPGDLLLTTAYNLRGDERLQRSLAARMVECGVSAMVVKCGYYLNAVPYPVRRQADDVALPVFELAREVPFVELSQSIYERLVSGSYARLQRSAGIHRELVRLVVEGADLATVVRRAAAMLGNAVAVEDATGRVLAGARVDGSALRLPRRALDRNGAIVVDVVARGITHGRVGIIPSQPPAADDLQALEQVATVVALDIAKSDRERLTEAELGAAFVRDLVHGRAGDDAACHGRGRRLGFSFPESPRVARLRPRRDDDGDALEAGIDAVRIRLGGAPFAARDSGEVVLVLSAEEEERIGADLAWLDTAGGFSGGIGGAVDRPSGLRASYVEAGRAMRLGAALRGAAGLHRFADVEAYDALLGDGDAARTRRVRERTVDRLPPELRRTLAVYLDRNQSVAETARELFVHRNTVHYRLHRIERLCELDLRRSEDRLLCQLGLLSARMT